MREKSKEFQINGILVLVLFGVFSVCVLSVLLTGAGAYRRLTERGQETYIARTIPQYITTRIRQADVSGGVQTGTFEGRSVLELTEEIDGKEYITRIYCYDGYIRELFTESSVVLKPSDGERIMEAEELYFYLEDAHLHVVFQVNDTEQEIHLALRSGEVSHEK